MDTPMTIAPLQEIAPMLPIEAAPVRVERRRHGGWKTVTALVAAGSMTIVACGSDANNNVSLGTDVPTTMGAESGTTTTADPNAPESATTTTLATEGGTTTTVVGDRTPIDGSDTVIAADAHITRCGVDASLEAWSANHEATILNQEANQDLLRSKEQKLFEKVGVNAATIFADKGLTYNDVDPQFTNSQSLYTRLLARADAVKMTDAAVVAYPVRENNLCLDTDGDGVGDKSLFRDDRLNRNNGENVTLLAITLTPEDYKAASDAAALEGITLDQQVMVQEEMVTVLDADGKEIVVPRVRVFFEDDSCGNQVFVSHPPELPPMIITTTIPQTETTPKLTIPGQPTTTTEKPPVVTEGPKINEGTVQGGSLSPGTGQDADPASDNSVTGYDPASQAEADIDGDGIHNSIDACPTLKETYNGFEDFDGCPDVAPLITVPDGVEVGTAPTSTDAPVVASTVVEAPPVVTVLPDETTTTNGADDK